MRNTTTGKVEDMDVGTASVAMRTYAPGASVPLYVPVGPVPGFTFKDDGGVEPTQLEPDHAVRVAQQQGAKNYPHRLAFGADDPAFEAAKVYRDDQVLRRVGQNKGFGEVFGERLADIATFGAYGAIQDEDEEDSKIRAYQNLYNPFASTMGTFGGVATSLLFPYGAAAKVLGKGAMAAGRASGLVRSAQVSAAASPIPTNLLTATAQVTRVTREALKAKGYGPFVQNYGGGLVSAAVAEAPLSLAVAAADIVDYNKDFSAQSLVADAGALWLTGMAIAAPIGFTGAAFRSGLGKARRGTAKVTGQGGIMGTPKDFALDVLETGAARASFGHGTWGGAFRWVAARKPIQWLRHGSNSRWAKAVTGEAIEQIEARATTARNIAKGMKVSHQAAPSVLRQTIADALPHAATPEVAAMLKSALNNTDDIITSWRAFDILQNGTLPKVSKRMRHLFLDAPKGDIYKAGGWSNVAFKQDWSDLAKATGPFAAQNKALSKELMGILQQAKTKPRQVTEKLLQARQAISDAPIGANKSGLINKIDQELMNLTNGDQAFRAKIVAFDDFTKANGEIRDYISKIGTADDFVDGAQGVEHVHKQLLEMQTAAKNMGLDAPMQKQLLKEVDIFEKASIRQGAEDLKGINTARKAIMSNEGSGIGSVLKFPKGELEALGFGDELLDTRIEAVMGFKSSTAEALKYLTLAGSPRAGAAAFGGILAYRNMTAEQKRENFESAREVILETAASPERMIETIGATSGTLAATDMEAGLAYSRTMATAMGYMLQQLPRSSDPLIGPADYSMQEIDSFFECAGALESPASCLACSKDGSVSIEGVDAIRTVYPELYTDMVLDLSEFMQTKEWGKLNEAQKLGLDTFTGGALGVLQTFGPMPGPLFAQTPMQQQALGKNMQQSSPQMARIQGKNNATSTQKVGAL